MTILFQSNYENGDFTGWGAEVKDVTATVEVQSIVKHVGNYAQHSILLANGSLAGRYCPNYAGQTLVYSRCYVYFVVFPEVDAGNFLSVMGANASGAPAGGGSAVKSVVHNNGVDTVWAMRYKSGDPLVETEVDTVIPVTLGRWYCVENKAFINAGAGEARLFVDNVEVATVTGIDNILLETMIRDSVGVFGGANSANMEAYLDDIVVSDEYIGPILGINLTLTNGMVFLT